MPRNKNGRIAMKNLTGSLGGWFCFLLFSVALTGCGATAKFVYPSNAQNLVRLYESPKYDRTVAVLPFEEARSDKNEASGFFLYLIPLVPYGAGSYERPDAARMFMSISEFTFNDGMGTVSACASGFGKEVTQEGLFYLV
jgi:hypothetical protein